MNEQLLVDLGELKGTLKLLLEGQVRLEVRIETKLSDLEARLRPLETLRVKAGVVYTLVASAVALAASHFPDILTHMKLSLQ